MYQINKFQRPKNVKIYAEVDDDGCRYATKEVREYRELLQDTENEKTKLGGR